MDNPQPTVDQQPSMTPSTPSRSNILPLLTVGMVMLLVGLGGGYLLFSNKNMTADTAPNKTALASPTVIQEESTTQSTIVPTSSERSAVKKTTTVPQANGASLANIKYTLPTGWKAEINGENLLLTPATGGGYLYVTAYNYPGTAGRREYYCKVRTVCIQGTTYFNEMNIGNISGYMANALDNSGGGAEYFGSKGNKFYVISSYNPPSPNDFENNYKTVLGSLIF